MNHTIMIMIGGISLYGWIYLVGLVLMFAYFLYWLFNINKNKRLSAILIGVFVSISLYLLFGIITSIIKTPFFARMTPVGFLEYGSLIVTSLLLGIYVALIYYGKATKKDKICNASATTGGVFGFLTFGCSICNKILVFFLGVAGVLTYFEPVRPFLEIFSILFLGFAIIQKARSIGLLNEFKNATYLFSSL